MEPVYNKKASFDYFLEDRFEAGLVLKGWEAKALFLRKINFDNAHIYIRNEEVFLLNALIAPLVSCSSHEIPEPTRTRKLLLKRKEISTLIGKVEQKGYTIVPVKLYRNKKRKYKIEIALAKGKKMHDKRDVQKDKDWEREQGRVMRNKFK